MRRVLFLFLIMIASAHAKTILIVGDSLSAGYGINQKGGWVSLLSERIQQKNLDYNVINISTSGDTTSNGLAKLPAALERYQPSIVMIELGANDGLRGLPLQAMRDNLQKMIEKSKAQGATVLLLATQLPPNYGQTFLTQFSQVYLDLAQQNAVTLVTMFLKGIAGNPQLMQPDGLHPNAKAQEKILENIWPVLLPWLK